MADNKDIVSQNISDESINETVNQIDDAMAKYEELAQQFDDQVFR